MTLGDQLSSSDDTEFNFFSVSLLGQHLLTYSNDCTTDVETKWKTFQSSCENYPTLATNYFNSTGYTNLNDGEEIGSYSGLNATYNMYSAQVCLLDSTASPVCAIDNQDIYSVNKIN